MINFYQKEEMGWFLVLVLTNFAGFVDFVGVDKMVNSWNLSSSLRKICKHIKMTLAKVSYHKRKDNTVNSNTRSNKGPAFFLNVTWPASSSYFLCCLNINKYPKAGGHDSHHLVYELLKQTLHHIIVQAATRHHHH